MCNTQWHSQWVKDVDVSYVSLWLDERQRQIKLKLGCDTIRFMDVYASCAELDRP